MHVRTLASRAGFTLVEVLLAAAMGALLLAAAASAAGAFAQTVAHLDSEASDSFETVLSRIDRDVRYAWSVDVPNRSELLVTGPDGSVTTYQHVGTSLMVTRPDGSTGALISGLSAFGFEADTRQRLRSGPDTTVAAAISSVAAPGGTTAALSQFASGQSIALSFMPGSNAGARSVAGVNDRYVSWTPTSIELPLAAVGLGNVTCSLYQSSGPGRGSPRSGATALSSWTVSLASLPVASILTTTPRTIYAAPATSVPLAIPTMSLEPGVAYTLVLDVSGAGKLNLSLFGSSARRDQMSKSGGGGWSALAGTVPFILHGDATCTTTSATTVTTQVRTTLQSSAGNTYVGSACVFSQVLADDPWQGVVPGEVPAGS